MKLLLLAFFVAAVSAVPLPEDGGEPVEMIVNGVPEGTPLEISDVLDIKLKERVDGNVVSATNLLHPFTAVGLAEAAAAAENTPSESAPSDVVPDVVVPDVIVPEGIALPEPSLPEVVDMPESVLLPEPPTPEVVIIPEAIVLPEPTLPEVVPEAIVLPEPALPELVPEAIVLPEPAVPEVVPEAIVLPEPAEPEVVPVPIIPEPITPEVVETPEDLPNPAPQFQDGELYNDGTVQVTVNAPESSLVSTLQSWFNMVVNYFNDGVQTSEQQIV